MDDADRKLVEKRKSWKLFGAGIIVRLLGVGLILLGDHHEDVFHKGLVIVGVLLSIGGIGILRFLLISGSRKKK